MYYYEPTSQCFELYERGPCAEGHILSYNYGELKPQCKCRDGYHLHTDGKCYSLNTEGLRFKMLWRDRDFYVYLFCVFSKGPCATELRNCPGTPCFMKSLEAIDVKCTCLPELSTTEDGRCYQPFTRGPCQYIDSFIVVVWLDERISFTGLANGWYLGRTAVPFARTKCIAKGLTIGTGGCRTKDATDSFLRARVRRGNSFI